MTRGTLANQVRASSGLANRRFALNISNDLRVRLVKPAFPRSAAYDAEWQFDTTMGPNILWLTEWGTEAVPLRPGMRVLDLGCGKAASSIFLAREFGVTVWAADLWIKPEDNLERIEAADMAERVLPVHAEAHALPFAEGYFDVIVSFDAYHYFGTDDLYLGISSSSSNLVDTCAWWRQGSTKNCSMGRRRRSGLIGNGSFVASTRPVGGVGIGPRQALSR
jgi:cyclopropane fatty-acyl-phospholipid synthase-like methyltransferase